MVTILNNEILKFEIKKYEKLIYKIFRNTEE